MIDMDSEELGKVLSECAASLAGDLKAGSVKPSLRQSTTTTLGQSTTMTGVTTFTIPLPPAQEKPKGRGARPVGGRILKDPETQREVPQAPAGLSKQRTNSMRPRGSEADVAQPDLRRSRTPTTIALPLPGRDGEALADLKLGVG